MLILGSKSTLVIDLSWRKEHLLANHHTDKILTLCLAVTSLSSWSSCAAPVQKNFVAAGQRSPLTLAQAETLHPGLTTQGRALQILGAADMKPELLELQGKETWLYLDEDHKATRLSLIFDSTTGKLETVNWFVHQGDPEASLNYIRNHYPTASLVKRNAKWPTPDAAPDETFFVDEKSGLKIVFARTPKQVEAIVWKTPGPAKMAKK